MTRLVSEKEADFAVEFRQLAQRGANEDVVTALFPMLTSADHRLRAEAETFAMAHRGLGDPSNPNDVRARQQELYAARTLVERHRLGPTPDDITSRYSPNDEVMEGELAKAGDGVNPFGKPGEQIAASDAETAKPEIKWVERQVPDDTPEWMAPAPYSRD